MTRRIVALLAIVAPALSVSACGYTMIKKSTLSAHRLPADSIQIMTLQSQIATLQAQAKQDSIRYAALKAAAAIAVATPAPSTPAVPDSVLRAKDQEIVTLKDQITQLNTELDRIKKRLASPKP